MDYTSEQAKEIRRYMRVYHAVLNIVYFQDSERGLEARFNENLLTHYGGIGSVIHTANLMPPELRDNEFKIRLSALNKEAMSRFQKEDIPENEI